MLMSLKAAALV